MFHVFGEEAAGIAQMATTQDVKVRVLQRKLYMLSKQKGGHRFYSLYDKVHRKDVLKEAYRQCRANKGKPGVDGVTFGDIEKQGVESWIDKMSQSLRNRRYKPKPVKRVYIHKPDGGKRPLGIPTIYDRVVQTACKIVIEPIFEARFDPDSYGYRPRKKASDAVKRIEALIKQRYVHIYDADLKGYFDTIPHEQLMDKLTRRISDSSLLSLLRKILRSPVAETDSSGKVRIKRSKLGTPQGGVVSPLFANIYLNDFMVLINTRTPCRMISYADDFVIAHRKPFTDEQLSWIRQQLEAEGLKVNEVKTRVLDMRKHLEDFDFLGYNFKRVPSTRWKGSWYLKIQPAKKSQRKFKDTIRFIIKHRTSRTLDELVMKVNPIIRGWKNYFVQCGYPRDVFFKMDWFIVGRFYRWAKRLSQRGSKCLTPNTLKILIKKGLEFFVAPRAVSVKGTL